MINWRQVSIWLTGGKEGIRSNKIPKRHEQAISELNHFIKNWKIKHPEYGTNIGDIIEVANNPEIVNIISREGSKLKKAIVKPDPEVIDKLKEIAQQPSKGTSHLYQQVVGHKHIYVNYNGYRVDGNKGIKGRPTQFFYCDTLEEAIECLNNLM